MNVRGCGVESDYTRDQCQAQWNIAVLHLEKAEASGDVVERRRIGEKVAAIFNEYGWPDWWSRLERMRTDTDTIEMLSKPW
jgi:hypothetical protein